MRLNMPHSSWALALVVACAEAGADPDQWVGKGYFETPPSYRNGTSDHDQGGWLEPEDAAPSPPSHSYTASDNNENPPPPYVYLVGRKHRDLAGNSRVVQADGALDTWLRFYPRNLEFQLNRGTGSQRWLAIKGLVLRTHGVSPQRQWDTLPGSRHPLLQVVADGRLVNRFDGDLSGFRPAGSSAVDLFIGDDGSLATRHVPMELEVMTLDGRFTLQVQRKDRYDQLNN
jgi:hypothetical protein